MKTHKYNIGDKVRVKKNLLPDEKYGGIRFDISMCEYRGKVAHIKDTSAGIFKSIHLREDGGQWYWSPEMLELVSPKAKKETKKKEIPDDDYYNDYYFDGEKSDEIEITKKSTDYRLKLGKYKIFATVSDKGITLKTYNDCEDFVFIESSPEMLKNIGALIMEAGKLI